MKKNNLFLAALAVAACTTVHCQTKMIAHRSHSESTAKFSTKGEGNFGEPPMRIDSLIKNIGYKNGIGFRSILPQA